MQSFYGKLSALGVLSGLAFAGGCASPVPGQVGAGGTGKSITVTMTFYGTMYPQNFYYYFLINRYTPAGQQQARGPIPVLQGGIDGQYGYGNGFATGSQNSSVTVPGYTDYGLTDYVYFGPTSVGANQIGLYHFSGSPDVSGNPPSSAQFVSNVFVNQLPDPTNNPFTLSFTLYLSQLVTDTTNPTAIANEVNNMRWLQVNIVATDVVPTNQTYNGNKNVDSMGNDTDPGQRTSFLVIDLTQNKTINSSYPIGTLQTEVQNDVFPCLTCNPSIDLESWSITVSP